MFIALDKLANQGIKKVIVAVPEKSIGRSFKNTNLKEHGFFEDWKVAQYFNLCDTSNERIKLTDSVSFSNRKLPTYWFAHMRHCVMLQPNYLMKHSMTVFLQ